MDLLNIKSEPVSFKLGFAKSVKESINMPIPIDDIWHSFLPEQVQDSISLSYCCSSRIDYYEIYHSIKHGNFLKRFGFHEF